MSEHNKGLRPDDYEVIEEISDEVETVDISEENADEVETVDISEENADEVISTDLPEEPIEVSEEVLEYEGLPKFKVTSSRVYIYADPNFSARSRGTLLYDDEVGLVEQTNGVFFKILVRKNGAFVSGYIRRTKVKKA